MRLTIQHLAERGLVDADQADELRQKIEDRPLSLYWHLRVILYLGVFLITTGLGIIIYQNIDSIGHITIIVLTAVVSLACLAWCFKQCPAFSSNRTEAENQWTDYLLLLGASTFLILLGYLQYQYNLFGTQYGLATFIPTVVLFFLAYRFDHLGVLTMAVILFASWVGINLSPKDFFNNNDMSSQDVIQAGFIIGLTCITAGFISVKKDFKPHFSFTYYNFSMHVLCITLLAGAASFSFDFLWLMAIAPLVYLGIRYAIQTKSFYFILISYAYGYIALSWLLVLLIDVDSAGLYFLFLYFIISAAAFILLIRSAYKKIQQL